MIRRSLPLLTLLILAAALLSPLPAAAGTYTVRQCHHTAPLSYGHEGAPERLPAAGSYEIVSDPNPCGRAAEDFALQIAPSAGTLDGQYGMLRFFSPVGAHFEAIELEAKLRREQGHSPRLRLAAASGQPLRQIAQGSGGATPFSSYAWAAGPDLQPRQFTAELICDNPGSSCPIDGGGSMAKTHLRDLAFTLHDTALPQVELSGPATAGGWLNGSATLELLATDLGGGLSTLAGTVNGEALFDPRSQACATIAGSPDVSAMQPCPPTVTTALELDTREAPFTEGVNEVEACARDYGREANRGCSEGPLLLRIDNVAPAVAFRGDRAPEAPELLRARVADQTSGLDADSGRIAYRREGTAAWLDLATELVGDELHAEVNSGALPPGNYEFRATISDLAGNEAITTLRGDGESMVLAFPLKEESRLVAELGNGDDNQLVGYRKSGEVGGLLTDSEGTPLATETVKVLETFAPGASLGTRLTEATTDAQGRYTASLAPGPSRDVDVLYPGSRRYAGDLVGGLDFDVRGEASLRVSQRRVRAGERIVFSGRVGRHLARIPAGGKLVEVQVKTPKGWTTLQQATGTDRNGAMKLQHRFRGFYTRPVTFTFRLRSTPENGWPFRSAATSKPRKVTVLPKRRGR